MIALTIAGSDSGGGAGIQADLKTFSALGVFGASVITAITAQNTMGVRAVHNVPGPIVSAQIAAVLEDLDVRAIKIGMVSDVDVIEAISDGLSAYAGPIVLDPVMVAASGDRLITERAEVALRSRLVPRAALITPNLPEAAVLLDTQEATTRSEMEDQARRLAGGEHGAAAVLLKGGHLRSGQSLDILAMGEMTSEFVSDRIETKNTHGTGCTLSSAIAAYLARGYDLQGAVGLAKAYVTRAIEAADQLSIGKGHGPVHHFHALWREAPADTAVDA